VGCQPAADLFRNFVGAVRRQHGRIVLHAQPGRAGVKPDAHNALVGFENVEQILRALSWLTIPRPLL
jgi:hypothetical protein